MALLFLFPSVIFHVHAAVGFEFNSLGLKPLALLRKAGSRAPRGINYAVAGIFAVKLRTA